MIKIYLCIGILVPYVIYQDYKINSLEKDYKQYKTEQILKDKITEGKIDNLNKTIASQNNQIEALKNYNIESDKNNTTINDIRKKYNNIPHNSKNITDFQNDIFGKMGDLK